MTDLMAGLHQPGDTVLHRLPVGAKVLGLAGLSLAIVLVRDVRAAPAFLAVTLLLAALARVPARSVWRAARGVLLIAVVASLLQWWWYGGAKAAETFLDLLSLGLAALALTATTEVNQMVDALARWARPLRVLGIDPDRVGLTVALTIGALPGTIAIARETRDAARARGLDRNPRAYLSPFVIRVVARAHESGDALHARGIGDD
ncbi:energy-coupling factor transporter transmembrane protein EcfT [Mycobacterium cookii]|uniref:Energy-coupling factor transporter transmembrane protein EcfT n=1 Tax=Nocardioides furvisabuli TaxID=375542 RepID=A0ABP5I8Q4_9ACTN|nr:CbiQ family ECF transporter T component [Nocardioides furvisabuli]